MAEILSIYISSFWAWAGISLGIGAILNFMLKVWSAWLRSRNIKHHGWPTAPMDADGDIIQNRSESP